MDGVNPGGACFAVPKNMWKERKRKKEKEERIMPGLVATMSALTFAPKVFFPNSISSKQGEPTLKISNVCRPPTKFHLNYILSKQK